MVAALHCFFQYFFSLSCLCLRRWASRRAVRARTAAIRPSLPVRTMVSPKEVTLRYAVQMLIGRAMFWSVGRFRRENTVCAR